MRYSFSCLAVLTALAAEVTSPGDLAGRTFAQQATSTALFRLFDGDSVDPRPDGLAQLADAIRRAQVPRECSLGKLTIFTAVGDPLFQQALAAARQAAVLRALEALGVNVAGRLFVDSIVFGGENPANDAQYEMARDQERPTLRTTSVPPKGSKVRPGQQIVVRMAARDDANRWQTGVKTIQLVADSEGGRFIAAENYAPCSEPREKRVEATYTVPANPPPIVRLTALAEDHAGLMDTDVGQFPTGDWYGTVKSTIKGTLTRGPNYAGTAVLSYAFSISADGALTGHAQVRVTTEAVRSIVPGLSDCTSTTSITPNQFSVPIAGRLDGNEFELVPSTVGNANVVQHVNCGSQTVQSQFTRPENPIAMFYFGQPVRVRAQDGATNTSSFVDWHKLEILLHAARRAN